MNILVHLLHIEYLLDWDPGKLTFTGSVTVTLSSKRCFAFSAASNPGNWMWLSCSAFFSQYCTSAGTSDRPVREAWYR